MALSDRVDRLRAACAPHAHMRATQVWCCAMWGESSHLLMWRPLDRTTQPAHHAVGSADRRAARTISCGARGVSATVGSRDAAAAYLGLELAAEPRLGVPPPATAFPPFAAAEGRRGDRRWFIWQLKPAATVALKVLNRWLMTLGRGVGAAGSSGRPTGSPARP